MTSPKQEKSAAFLQYLAIANQLVLKALSAKTFEALKFILLNDTIHLIRYNRAILWSLESTVPKPVGFSGQTKFKNASEMVEQLTLLAKNIPNKERPQQLTREGFPHLKETWNAVEGEAQDSLVIWFPIKIREELKYGLWVEKWKAVQGELPSQEALDLCATFLMPAYGFIMEKYVKRNIFTKLAKPSTYLSLAAALLLLLFLVRIPLRIVAPCEVIPENPYVITAPLEGIIEEIVVKPGELVKKGNILFEYDKRAPMHELRMAEKQVAMVQSEVNRAMTLGNVDKKSLAEVVILKAKLEREKVNLDYAKHQAELLHFRSPIDGVVIFDNPEEWQGRPVKIGEKILTISDPEQSRIRVWLQEHDNINLDLNTPISIFLNINPIKSYQANLIYVANEATLSDKKVPSFIAEADWVDKPKDVKLGLTGNAILYGERVTLFYFIMRKPWGTIRNFLGI